MLMLAYRIKMDISTTIVAYNTADPRLTQH